MSRQPLLEKPATGLAGDRERGTFDEVLAVQQQVIEEYIREVEAEYQWHRLRFIRPLRHELHRMRRLLHNRPVKMIACSIATVLAAGIMAGATGHVSLAPLFTRPQQERFVQRHVVKPAARPLRDGSPLGRCTNYMSDEGYLRWLRHAGSQPVCP
jgi:hypothetical protein